MEAKEGGVAAFELPRVISGSPFYSPRGDYELSLVSSPSSPVVSSVTIVDRDGVGSLRSASIKAHDPPYVKLVLIGDDRASMRLGETGFNSGTILSLYFKGISYPLLTG